MIRTGCLFLLLTSYLAAAPRTYPESLVHFVEKERLQPKREFILHESKLVERLHWINENLIFQPFYAFIHAQAYYMQPLPGFGKELSSLRKKMREYGAFLGCCLTCTPALHSLAVGLPIRYLLHGNRPFLSYIQTEAPEKQGIELSKEHPLHLASFNVSFTPSSVNIKMDMRPPLKRAEELASAILSLKSPPDVLMIEEGWHRESLELFCNRLGRVYPHILHSIAPQIVGMSSGCAVFSMYPIEDVKYIKFEKMPPPHDLPPRGITRIHLKAKHGPLYIYGGIHTQSMNDIASVEARIHQIGQIAKILQEDAGALQVVMGDMNTTPVDMWGYNNLELPEGRVWTLLKETFDDLFARDHDPVSGIRIAGSPLFLAEDNARMGVQLPEPVASWYDGPFLQGREKSQILAEMHREFLEHGYTSPQLVREIGEVTWGTSKWFEEQSATRARFDYILLPKDSELDGRAEIRRIVMEKGSQSPASDHLPVHALIWLK
jgi:endonuclease/exonuclease/phosphatase family metal-dependent hydrolase